MHLPKTGGTSLVNVLEQSYGAAHSAYLHGDEDKSFAEHIQRGTPFLHGHISGSAAATAGGYFSATLLRDPVARVVSRYVHILHSEGEKHRAEVAGYRNFEDYLQSAYAQNWQCRSLAAVGKAPLSSSELLEQGQAALAQLDWVGLTEQLPAAVFDLSQKLALTLKKPGKQNRRQSSALWYRLYEKYHLKIAALNHADATLYASAANRFARDCSATGWRYWRWRFLWRP